MDMLMLVITVVSVVVAVAASVIAWRATRAERQRSAARIAALTAAAGLARSPEHPGETTSVETPAGLHEFMPAREARAPGGAGAAMPAAAGSPAPAGVEMFGAPVTDSGSGHRQRGLLAAAAVVAVLVATGGLALLVSGRAPSPAGTATRAPLELVALGHVRTDGQLVVTGHVQNPAAGRTVEQLEAQVRAFDAAGIMIATRSALADTPSLAPGQDTSFAVTLGEAITATRYRVSFGSRGTMLAHVDRRTNLPAAVTADAR